MSEEIVPGKKVPVFDKIINNLYLGDIEAAESEDLLSDHNIKRIINISNKSRQAPFTRYTSSIETIHMDIDDNRDENISQFFEKFFTYVNETEGNVLVHCMNSVSRSVSLVISYLIYSMSFREAIIYLKSKRTQYSRPNIGFIKQLIEWETEIRGSNSLSLSEAVRAFK